MSISDWSDARKAPKILRDLLTGPDGETWHAGRVAAVIMFFTGLPLPWVQLFQTAALDLTGAGIYYGGLGAAVWGLVQGAKNMDIMPGTPPPVDPAPSGKPTGEAKTP